MKLVNKIQKYCGSALIIAGAISITLNSCTEKIDDSSLYTFTGETLASYIEKTPEFSEYYTLLKKVHPSDQGLSQEELDSLAVSGISRSTMFDLLSARGNYTCFAPTNSAMEIYLEEQGTTLSQLTDSMACAIVFNSLIENDNDEAYASTDFEEGALDRLNMNDRYISVSYGNDSLSNTETYINVNSKIVQADIEVQNGYIHAVDHVLSPSNASIADLVETTPNTQIFGELLRLTKWDVKLTDYRDMTWEKNNEDIRGTTTQGNPSATWEGLFPEHRYIGYTIFVEPDSVYEDKGLMSTSKLSDLSKLKAFVQQSYSFEDGTVSKHPISWGDDFESEYNWLNMYVAYHILPERLTYNNMVVFANEYGFYAAQIPDRKSTSFSVNVWEYWETMGPQRRQMKITGCRESGTVQRRINRKSNYNQGTYKEISSTMSESMKGILVNLNNGEYNNDALNGTYFTINDILIWEERVPNYVLNERMRFDITSLFPEFMTNNIRGNRATGAWYFPVDYLDNLMDMTSTTYFLYAPNQGLQSGTGSWMDYQIDEFNIRGQYDFTMKLPPVPRTGTYELRYGVWANGNRGMAQIYMGKNWKNLPAIGIPLDLRDASGAQPAATGWVTDASLGATTADSTALYENQKTMRNLGFMKGPKYIQVNGGTGRDSQNNLRKIIYTGEFEAGETYYIRFKNVLSSNTSEFFYDYIEFVPKSIYAGEYNEDIW